MRFGIFILSALLAAGAAAPTWANTIIDPAGDFLGSYTGPQNGDLDILSASARFDGSAYRLGATLGAAVGTTGNTLQVFGVNRGTGTARFMTGPDPVGSGALFDAVVVLFPGQVVRVVDFQPAAPPIITQLTNAATVNGGSFELLAPLSLLPSRGFAAADYVFSMWTRRRINPLMDSGNFEIGDFAPDATGFTASIPEPATWAMLITGFGAVGLAVRRRRRLGEAKTALC